MSSSDLRMRLLLASALLVSACTVPLQHDLDEDDANDIYVLLQKNGIGAQKVKDESGNVPKYVIHVAKADVASAAQYLREYSLPRPKAEGLGVFRKNKGMIPTQVEERAMFIEALGGEVSNSLNRVAGVLEARTIVMIPEVNDLTQPDNRPLPSASVLVKYRPTPGGKAPLTEDQIRSFVASAVPEMKADHVTVLLTEARPPESEDDPNRLQKVLGFDVARGSVDRFRVFVSLMGVIVLGMFAAMVWAFVRAGSTRTRGASDA